MQWQDPVRSQAGVGIAGVLLLSISVAAGLGFCALLGDYFTYFTSFSLESTKKNLMQFLSKYVFLIVKHRYKLLGLCTVKN